MRSEVFMADCEKNVKRVRRPRVEWRSLMLDLNNPQIEMDYWKFKQAHLKMSDNRCAYNVLKTYYSTTSLDRVRWLGDSL